LGPIFALTLLDFLPPLPYLICSAISLGTAFLVVQRLCRGGQPAVGEQAANLAK
jgi:hypothetical protein